MGKLKNAAISNAASSPNGGSTLNGAAAHARSVEDVRGGAVADAPPSTNRGGMERAPLASLERLQIVVTDSGEVKTIPVRVPTGGQVAMIDTLRFTVGEETWAKTAGIPLVDDEAIVFEASRHLTDIFGFGVTANMQRPRDFYLNAWELGDGYGYVALGGSSQRTTMLVNLTGQGCLAAKPGWEGRLYDFLKGTAKRPTITRVDLAHDCFEGEYTVDQADQWYDDGLFSCSGRSPSHEHRGDWRNPSGKGRSLYVGLRRNGKLCRVYEKGMEQGDGSSPWVRFEVEIRNNKRVIPFDVLVDPSGYFVGAYPCLKFFADGVAPQRVEVKRRAAEINVDASLRNIRASYGKYVGVLRPLLGDEAFLEAITNSSGEWPERLKVADYELCDSPIHTREPSRPFNDLDPSDDGWTGDAVFNPAAYFDEDCYEIRQHGEGTRDEGEQGRNGQRYGVRFDQGLHGDSA
ncbi:replication initiation factor domain-containing protein [Burkholderia ambifaria]|uniref:replication initiation factor domain-containing protein n=1 Tax=Burkholderia ambifaria TaxID=152480 RepID=UPI00158E075B|nr:replication initiation factor domain-containing protein [Burkholderia ambifaria]